MRMKVSLFTHHAFIVHQSSFAIHHAHPCGAAASPEPAQRAPCFRKGLRDGFLGKPFVKLFAKLFAKPSAKP